MDNFTFERRSAKLEKGGENDRNRVFTAAFISPYLMLIIMIITLLERYYKC